MEPWRIPQTSRSALLTICRGQLLSRPGVMLNKDGSLQKTVAFRGPDLDSSTPYELVAARARMNNVLRRLGSHWCVHVEASRRLAHVYPASEFPIRSRHWSIRSAGIRSPRMLCILKASASSPSPICRRPKA